MKQNLPSRIINFSAMFNEFCVDIPLEAAMKDVHTFCFWNGPTPIITTQNPEDIKVGE